MQFFTPELDIVLKSLDPERHRASAVHQETNTCLHEVEICKHHTVTDQHRTTSTVKPPKSRHFWDSDYVRSREIVGGSKCTILILYGKINWGHGFCPLYGGGPFLRESTIRGFTVYTRGIDVVNLRSLLN